MNIELFIVILCCETATSVLKTKFIHILCDGNPSVLCHSMKILVNNLTRLTVIKVLCVAYLKHEHCAQQYSVRHVYIYIYL